MQDYQLSSETYIVQEILGHKYDPKLHQLFYLVKWLNYDNPQDNTYEPEWNLIETCAFKIEEYIYKNDLQDEIQQYREKQQEHKEKKEKKFLQPKIRKTHSKKNSKQNSLNNSANSKKKHNKLNLYTAQKEKQQELFQECQMLLQQIKEFEQAQSKELNNLQSQQAPEYFYRNTIQDQNDNQDLEQVYDEIINKPINSNDNIDIDIDDDIDDGETSILNLDDPKIDRYIYQNPNNSNPFPGNNNNNEYSYKQYEVINSPNEELKISIKKNDERQDSSQSYQSNLEEEYQLNDVEPILEQNYFDNSN